MKVDEIHIMKNINCQACDVVIKVFTCIRTAWNRNMFATVLTTITTICRPGFIWRPGFMVLLLDTQSMQQCVYSGNT